MKDIRPQPKHTANANTLSSRYALAASGVVADYATLAELAHVSRARMSQIMNLLMLAPDIQETLLFLPRTLRGREARPASVRVNSR